MLKKVAKWIGIVFGSIILLIGVAYGGMRISDGPVEFFPWFTISIGGPFRSGEITESPENWDFIKEKEEIEFQTLNPSTSRTVYALVVDGTLYIVSGYMSSTIGKLWKQWPVYMEQDNRVLIRVDSNIYEQRLNRITEGTQKIQSVMAEIGRKYGAGNGQVIPGSEIAVTSEALWMFEVIDM